MAEMLQNPVQASKLWGEEIDTELSVSDEELEIFFCVEMVAETTMASIPTVLSQGIASNSILPMCLRIANVLKASRPIPATARLSKLDLSIQQRDLATTDPWTFLL